MSFDSTERSLAAGRPVRLYRFSRGETAWCYTSGDREIIYQTQTYTPVAGGILDDGIRQTGQDGPDNLTLTAPAQIAIAQLYRVTPPSTEVVLTVFSGHLVDNDYIVCWSGGVRSIKWPALDRCEILCSPLSSRMTITGLRLTWGRACPHALYTPACGVDPAARCVDGIIAARDGTVIQIAVAAERPDDTYTGGFIEWTGDNGIERRGIAAHTGATLAPLGGTAGIAVGTAVQLYPGCRQTVAGCKAFGNFDNFGGIPHLPGVSPFDGRNIF
jgi:uncharacterized phage protein (TIGR02218 family)